MSTSVFKHIISSEYELRSMIGFPSELVSQKAISFIDSHCREFISKSPLLFVSTSSDSGHCDVSPRGDEAGFVFIFDQKHLIIPERPGNRRIDSLRNILSNPQIGLIFLIPGLEETLRINGLACIIRDPDLMHLMQANDKIPLMGIGVEVEECFIHCAKAFKRSKLWSNLSWPNKDDLPSISQILADHVNKTGITVEEVTNMLKESYEKRLY